MLGMEIVRPRYGIMKKMHDCPPTQIIAAAAIEGRYRVRVLKVILLKAEEQQEQRPTTSATFESLPLPWNLAYSFIGKSITTLL